MCALPSGLAQETAAPAAVAPATVEIDRFVFRYGLAHPDLPALDALAGVGVTLARSEGGAWTAATPGGETLTLRAVPAGSRFDVGALRAAVNAIVQWFNDRGIYGVWVAFDGVEATPTGLFDGRPQGERAATLVVWASQIAEVRTLARGSRFRPEKANNHPKHRRILRDSPLQPAGPDRPQGSLFLKEELEAYVQRLSAHPGRRVEASIASAGKPGEVVLDLLVNETRPWQIAGQISNTGTETTDPWRARVGFQHNQITNHDDILNFDFVTTPDLGTWATFASYRRPLVRSARLQARVYGSFGDFLADGVALENLRFAGRNWFGGGEAIYRTGLGRGWELTGNLGANYSHYAIESRIGEASLAKGSSEFLVPFLGANVARRAAWWSLSAGLRLEHSIDGVANTDPTNGVPALGRLGADAGWTSLRWNAGGSMFLEPLFSGGRGTRLAHEISLRARGRMLLRGSRVIPQEQEGLGGAFTVRGYPESVVAADESVLAGFEYAWHLPRSLRASEPGTLFGRTFRWRPQGELRKPDWDLVLRGFFDYGLRLVTPAPSTSGAVQIGEETPLIDRDLSLMGVGAGLELVVKETVSIRCDVAQGLTDLKDENTTLAEAGDVRFYLITSFAW